MAHWREKTEKSGIGTLLWNSYTAYILRLRLRESARQRLVFIIVPEEIFLGGIVGPNVFNAFIHFTFILYFLQVLEHLERSTRTGGIVYKFVLGCGPRCIFQF